MTRSLPESLTQQFYDSEQRARGWWIHETRVPIEPAFRPFVRSIPTPANPDDGRRLTIWKALWRLVEPAHQAASYARNRQESLVRSTTWRMGVRG